MTKRTNPSDKYEQSASEQQLVLLACAGNANAFGKLYERHMLQIYRYIYYQISHKEDSEDLTELVFMKAWESLGSYKATDVPFKAWLYRIAHNLVVDRYRNDKQELSLDNYSETRDPQQNIDDYINWLDDSQGLSKALAQLESSYRQVVTLRFIVGLTHSETAKIVQLSENNVRVIQYRALQMLRKILLPTGNL